MGISADITLDHATHTYRNSQGRIYTSVSKIIGQYKAPFDRMGQAQRVAEKSGRDISAVLSEWDSAAPYGTAVHAELEAYFRGEPWEWHLIKPYLWVLEDWKKQPVKFHPEVILSDEDLGVAGTADMLVERADGSWSIVDWKTNSAIRKWGFDGQMLKPPLTHLFDCNYVHYSLQLSFYARMMGEPIHRLSLVHLPRGKETIKVIHCPVMMVEVDDILEDWVQAKV